MLGSIRIRLESAGVSGPKGFIADFPPALGCEGGCRHTIYVDFSFKCLHRDFVNIHPPPQLFSEFFWD